MLESVGVVVVPESVGATSALGTAALSSMRIAKTTDSPADDERRERGAPRRAPSSDARRNWIPALRYVPSHVGRWLRRKLRGRMVIGRSLKGIHCSSPSTKVSVSPVIWLPRSRLAISMKSKGPWTCSPVSSKAQWYFLEGLPVNIAMTKLLACGGPAGRKMKKLRIGEFFEALFQLEPKGYKHR